MRVKAVFEHSNISIARMFYLSCIAFFALCASVRAQQAMKIPRLGFIAETAGPSTPSPLLEAFRQGLRELGYTEGKNLLIEYRYMGGISERSAGLVTDLVQLKVDVIVSSVPSALRAAKEATQTIPIVMLISSDPVASGLVGSMARPGGNVTGIARLTHELGGKRLELLKEIIPAVSRIGVLSVGTRNPLESYEADARALKLSLHSIEMERSNPNLESAFQSAKDRVDALIVISNTTLLPLASKMADLAIKHRLPSMNERSDYVDAGGLISFSGDDAESFRRAAAFVDKVLKGAKPADLPVERANKFEIVINLKTAKQIGITIPPNVLARADRVIK